MTRGRNEALRRVLLLQRRLEGSRYSPSLLELAGDYNVTTRTIRRDLEVLESVGCLLPRWRDEYRARREQGTTVNAGATPAAVGATASAQGSSS